MIKKLVEYSEGPTVDTGRNANNSMHKNTTISLLAFILLIWGFMWPINKMALDYSPPILYAGLRILIGGLLLVALYWRTRNRIQWRKNWKPYVVCSVFIVVFFNGIQSIGLLYLPSGLFSVIVYIQPVLVGLLAWRMLKEPMNTAKAIGLLLGFIGVAAISINGMSIGGVNALGVLLAIATAASWAYGAVYIKKVGERVDAVWLTAIQSIIGGVVLTSTGLMAESWGDIVWNSTLIFAMIFTGIFGVAASWIVYFVLVKKIGASEIASYTFLVPVISVVASMLLLDETLTADLLIGMVLIMTSIWLVNRKSGVGRATTRSIDS